MIEYNDGLRQVRRSASLHVSSALSDDSNNSKKKFAPTYSRFAYQVYSDEESDGEDAFTNHDHSSFFSTMSSQATTQAMSDPETIPRLDSFEILTPETNKS